MQVMTSIKIIICLTVMRLVTSQRTLNDSITYTQPVISTYDNTGAKQGQTNWNMKEAHI
jgi:hypothetical protein